MENTLASSAAIATVCTLFLSAVIWYVQRQSQRVSRVYELFRFYYGPEHYQWIHGPTQAVISKWYNLPDSDRAAYRSEVVRFWSGFNSNQEFLRRFVDIGDASAEHWRQHFVEAASKGYLTEAQALDCNLHFWSGLYEMIELGIIDRRSCTVLFKAPFQWRSAFYRELGAEVRAAMRPGDPEPDWIRNTERLEKILAPGGAG